jgi:hypothetical protein
MIQIPSYGSIYALGHKAIGQLFDGPVVVEEKIDGSQISFGVIDGELGIRSKGAQINPESPEPMFNKAVETILELYKLGLLHSGFIYRGEYLKTTKHNTLNYSRIPNKHIILFDVMVADGERYLSPYDKSVEAKILGLEVVPTFEVNVKSLDELKALVERESVLGGQKMEGVVIKNYNQFTPDKKIMMGKYVREEFKEAHQVEWKQTNPTRTDIVQALVAAYKTDARWEKAIQHLRDAGKLTDTPKDIGLLIKEVPEDILKEAEDEIKSELFKYFWPQIRRGVIAGFPEWYKDKLSQTMFA